MDAIVGTMWTIVHDRLCYGKVCAHWVSKQLIDQQKELHMGIAYGNQSLFRYHEDPTFLDRIITGDESWCNPYEPEAKRDSMQWKHMSSLFIKKFKPVVSEGKV